MSRSVENGAFGDLNSGMIEVSWAKIPGASDPGADGIGVVEGIGGCEISSVVGSPGSDPKGIRVQAKINPRCAVRLV